MVYYKLYWYITLTKENKMKKRNIIIISILTVLSISSLYFCIINNNKINNNKIETKSLKIQLESLKNKNKTLEKRNSQLLEINSKISEKVDSLKNVID